MAMASSLLPGYPNTKKKSWMAIHVNVYPHIHIFAEIVNQIK